jgi:5-methylcytosine-specific restriction endonuclease McrA
MVKAVYGRVVLDQELCLKCNNMFFPENKGEQYCSYCIGEVDRESARARLDTSDRVIIKSDKLIPRIRKHVTPFLRKKIAKRDEFVCQYCDKFIGEDFCIDHFIPYSAGGGNELTNLYCACRRCNSLKSKKLFEDIGEARAYIKLRNEGKSIKSAENTIFNRRANQSL